MTAPQKLTFYHCPNTRSSMVALLLEELGASDVQMVAMSSKKGENRQPAYLAINPLGKVPALRHGDALITETVACYLYLADLYPQAGLAPPLGDPLRGPYLRWMVYYAAAFEPAVVDVATKREPAPHTMSPYGTFDGMLKVLNDQLARSRYLLGNDRFSAADILWGAGLNWTTRFGLVPVSPEIKSYLDHLNSRPTVARHRAAEMALSKQIDA